MASDDTLGLIRSIVERYLRVLEDNRIRPQKVFLYGSAARGGMHPYSDIDLAVVSEDLTGRRLEDQLRLMELRWPVDLRLEPHPFRPEDFTPDDPEVAEILQTGVEIC